MKISVVIPAYNEAAYLGDTLESLRKQTLQPFEIIVVANGCTDDTANIAKEYTSHVLVIPRLSIGAVRNKGFIEARGEVIIFLDADTTLASDALEIVSKTFTSEYAVGTIKALPDPWRATYRFYLGLKNFLHWTRIFKGMTGVLVVSGKLKGMRFPSTNLQENRLFIKKGLARGNYFYSSRAVATTSMRRYEQWGVWYLWYFWLKNIIARKFGKLKNDEYEPVR